MASSQTSYCIHRSTALLSHNALTRSGKCLSMQGTNVAASVGCNRRPELAACPTYYKPSHWPCHAVLELHLDRFDVFLLSAYLAIRCSSLTRHAASRFGSALRIARSGGPHISFLAPLGPPGAAHEVGVFCESSGTRSGSILDTRIGNLRGSHRCSRAISTDRCRNDIFPMYVQHAHMTTRHYSST